MRGTQMALYGFTNDQIKVKIIEHITCDFTLSDIPDSFCDMIRISRISFEGAAKLLDEFIKSYESKFEVTREELEEEIEDLKDELIVS